MLDYIYSFIVVHYNLKAVVMLLGELFQSICVTLSQREHFGLFEGQVKLGF